MNAGLFVLEALLAMVVSLVLTPVVRLLALRIGAVDMPTERKIHRQPMPRLGGLAVVGSVAIVLAAEYAYGGPPLWWTSSHVYLGLLLGLLPILALSTWDDIRPLGAWPRLFAQVLGATVAITLGIVLAPTVHLFGLPVTIGWLAVPISLVWLVGVTNAFNIIDGLDGLAAGLAFISASTMVGVFFFAGHSDMARIAGVLAGALLGFLPYNVHPARVFLGDSGATAIGFLLGCLTLKGGSTLSAGLATLLPLVLLGVPIADTAISMGRRLIHRMAGETDVRVFGADRNHIHHRLLASGLNHRNAVWLLYGVGAALAGVVLLSLLVTARTAGFLLLATLCAGYVGVRKLGYEEFATVQRGLVVRFSQAPMLQRSFFVVFVDLVLVAFAVFAAIGLHFGRWAPSLRDVFYEAISVLAPITVAALAAGGMYRGSWRFTTVADIVRACKIVIVSTLAAFLLNQFVFNNPPPLPVFVIYALLMVVLVNGSRLLSGLVGQASLRARSTGEPVLIYGAGRAGVIALREMLENHELKMKPVGFIDDDAVKSGWSVNGVKVLGREANLAEIIRKTAARKIIVASRAVSVQKIQHAVDICGGFGVQVLRAGIQFSDCVPAATVERTAETTQRRAGGVEVVDPRRVVPTMASLLADKNAVSHG